MASMSMVASGATIRVPQDQSIIQSGLGAARRLSDPTALEQASMRATDRDVLKILLAEIEDNAVLNRIAVGAADRPVRLAAASWLQVMAGIMGLRGE